MSKILPGIAVSPNSPSTMQKVKATIDVHRTGNRKDGAFFACIRLGKNRVCKHGKNPRVAIGKALSAAGRKVAGRKGAYAGKRRR
jgi:hypothetical protein